ncbi:propionyl-CoA carboxylase [Rickenella mellea]|uniref:Propionyl-CoA carboxylase n=1 Tax=Rickenella mellea TaxID=50990 RepID=A0A4Y7QB42_9AGAM|nr:propionyl-CoA carboxylase [Rickenella mellea]
MPSEIGAGNSITTKRLQKLKDHLKSDSKYDGTSWKHAIAQMRTQQAVIHSPNSNNPGYLRQREAGKLWIHDRITAFIDKDSFREIGSITGRPVNDDITGTLKVFVPGNIVIGWGKVLGQNIVLTADDFSVRGGHADGGVYGKAAYAEDLARKSRVPLIRLLDGSSGGGSVKTYLDMGATYIPSLAGLGQSMETVAIVPVASALLGPVVGLGAAKAVLSHFSVMVRGLSQSTHLFAAWPPVVKQATFENLSKEALGGWQVHGSNGTVDNIAMSEEDAFAQIRRFLSFFPSSIFALPPILSTNDTRNRREESLISIIPRRRARLYDIRRLIQLVVDTDRTGSFSSSSSFFETGTNWGQCIVTGFARLDGKTIGILSSDCTYNGGALDGLGSQKTARFVHICDQFGIPIFNLVDQPGFAVGSTAEKLATIRHGATAMSALYNSTIPMFTVIIRRCFGVAGGAFAHPDGDRNVRVAWPSADWGSLPLEGGIEAAYKRELDATGSSEEREELMTQLMAKFEHVRDPSKTAHLFNIEEIIDPRDTRPLACEWVANAYEHVLPQRLVARQAAAGINGQSHVPRS